MNTKTEARFKATSVGTLPKDVTLEPDAWYEIARRVPPTARPFHSRDQLVSWITKCVLGDLRTLLAGAELRTSKDLAAEELQLLGGGNFYLAAGCCMALEYLAWIYTGNDDATAGVNQYVTHFLEPVDVRYARYWPLLWRALRNGIIHGAWPQAVCLKESPAQRLLIGVGIDPTDSHLVVGKSSWGPALLVNARHLLFDIVRSVEDSFGPWLRATDDVAILDRAGPRLIEIRPGFAEGRKAFRDAMDDFEWAEGGPG